MSCIWKFPLYLGTNELNVPRGARILALREQGEIPCLWMLVDPEAPTEKRTFRMHGTGHAIEGDPGVYLGTALIEDGALVLHVFETTPAATARRSSLKAAYVQYPEGLGPDADACRAGFPVTNAFYVAVRDGAVRVRHGDGPERARIERLTADEARELGAALIECSDVLARAAMTPEDIARETAERR